MIPRGKELNKTPKKKAKSPSLSLFETSDWIRIPGFLFLLLLIILLGGLFSRLFVLLGCLGSNLRFTFGWKFEQTLVLRWKNRPISESFIPKLNQSNSLLDQESAGRLRIVIFSVIELFGQLH